MDNSLALNPFEVLKHAVTRAFPERGDITKLEFDGTLAQAWQTYARLLAIDETELARRLAPLYGVEAAGPLFDVNSDILSYVPYNMCQAKTILPLRMENNRLVIATANPFDTEVTERINFLVSKPTTWVLAPPEAIGDAISYAFNREATREAGSEISGTGSAAGVAAQALSDNPIIKLGIKIVLSAIAQRASDLHVQPFLGSAAVRIRVDGVLRRLTMLPEAVATTLLRHFKANNGMDSTNTLIPQDGRASKIIDGREFDLRISVLPVSHGERLVIRFLEQGRVHNLSNAGFSLAALQVLRRAIARPSGMVILTGPTGSGKTSTLYSMLSELNHSAVNIMTVENPVEYRIPGISQVEVNEKTGLSFSAALRSILRQDPDIILIGEIRDRETAEIAAQAALTGHLVLTTLHTTDALSAIPRLLSLGLQPSLLADAIATVASQRLCRSLCTACRVPVVEPLTPVEKLFQQLSLNKPGHRATGCKHCDYTGYRGRLPIVDIVEVSPRLRDAIALGESRLSVLEACREGGLKSLAASGSLRIISGDTTIQEVMDAVGPGFWAELARHFGTNCSTNELDLLSLHAAADPGVLLMSQNADTAQKLEPVLREQGYRLVVAETADIAHDLLKQDEEIVFILGELGKDVTATEAADHLRNNRLKISWARLPSVVLLPAPLLEQEDFLRESGVMATFMPEPLDVANLMLNIRRSQAR